MKTLFNNLLKNKLQHLLLVITCMLSFSAIQAQDTLCKDGVDTVPCRYCNVKLPRPFTMKWLPGPGTFTAPIDVEFYSLVIAAAQAWNDAWTAAGKPGILLELKQDTAQQCSCILDTVVCAANFNVMPVIPPIRACKHGQFKDVVSLCRNDFQLGANNDDPNALRVPGYPGASDSTADCKALAVTYPDCNAKKCLNAADICVETAFARNCKPIPWFVEVTNLAMLYVNHTKGKIPLAKIDMFSVLVHEFGHYLGLDHSLDKKDVMYGSIELGETRRRPNTKEVLQIKPCKCKCEE